MNNENNQVMLMKQLYMCILYNVHMTFSNRNNFFTHSIDLISYLNWSDLMPTKNDLETISDTAWVAKNLRLEIVQLSKAEPNNSYVKNQENKI